VTRVTRNCDGDHKAELLKNLIPKWQDSQLESDCQVYHACLDQEALLLTRLGLA
jgi:hypothetical protein